MGTSDRWPELLLKKTHWVQMIHHLSLPQACFQHWMGAKKKGKRDGDSSGEGGNAIRPFCWSPSLAGPSGLASPSVAHQDQRSVHEEIGDADRSPER